MSNEAPRYAVYFAPDAGSALSRFGTGIIGYDAWSGLDMPFDPPVMAEVNAILNADWHPRRYGFHATLKAPITLADPDGEGALLDFAARYAATARSVRLDGLALEWLGNNFALRPEGDVTALNALAFEIVRAFDPFRAPLTEAERARRLAGKLTPRQIENLDCWGYHYVDADFWFHMTLTGPIAPERQAEIASALEEAYRRVPSRPVLIDNVTIFRQDSRSVPFRILQRFPFAG
ncbi:MAG: DUF1045 domain-containing protein [Beijerinckiaceae bacterium]|nr:DUF1045 domain-containing protein [Beijerinckiaceae bacterium]MCZ8299969.1 DUF1045 domain-containing protein [Beijerinckiaceae bacterium]